MRVDIGKLVRDMQAAFRVSPGKPIFVDPSKVTWASMKGLTAMLEGLTSDLIAEFARIEASGVPTGDPIIERVDWRQADVDYLQKALDDWMIRLAEYVNTTERGLRGELPPEEAWPLVGEPLLYGVGGPPDFITPFTLINQAEESLGAGAINGAKIREDLQNATVAGLEGLSAGVIKLVELSAEHVAKVVSATWTGFGKVTGFPSMMIFAGLVVGGLVLAKKAKVL